jgi:Cu(I)/Ag(I) efflux system membrane fusion protein
MSASERSSEQRVETRRWWIKLLLQPLLLLAGIGIAFAALGVLQRVGWFQDRATPRTAAEGTAGEHQLYICPMVCTPPQPEPGRCPVCGMELVPTTQGAGQGDGISVQIDPAARRIANIQTDEVKAMEIHRKVRVVGEISYDEGKLKTIAAYVNGRVERLLADYTGVVVQQNDRLALIYSPELYSGQVELLLARKSLPDRSTTTLRTGVSLGGQSLYESARQRLIELGMTESQIGELEATGEATSRMYLHAPISGTVIEKMAVEGGYVTEGQPIYRLADLSTVWLMLELFPEDAAAIRYGQKVLAEVQSLPGQVLTGRVAFIDPNVNPKTRTVGVRVVIQNPRGSLRVGDYAKATIEVPQHGIATDDQPIFDEELASKWISPRHPHIIQDNPGKCTECGMDLVPSAEFGYASTPLPANQSLTVPRSAVLTAGEQGVVYVETDPGRFELRRVVLGHRMGDRVVVLKGLKQGEQVATRGNFLIDSQMQLAGNPSLIDPTKSQPTMPETPEEQIIAALDQLSPDDRTLAEQQKLCPVLEVPLGSMGKPIKVDVNGTPVFICCSGCRSRLLAEPHKYLEVQP